MTEADVTTSGHKFTSTELGEILLLNQLGFGFLRGAIADDNNRLPQTLIRISATVG